MDVGARYLVRAHHDTRVSDWLLEVELLDKAELLSPHHMPRLFYRFGGVSQGDAGDIMCECPVCYTTLDRPFGVGAMGQHAPQGRITVTQPTLWGTLCPVCPRPVALLMVPDRIGVNLTTVARAGDGEMIHWNGDTKTAFPTGAACGASARPLGRRGAHGGRRDWSVTIWTIADRTTAHQITCPACKDAVDKVYG